MDLGERIRLFGLFSRGISKFIASQIIVQPIRKFYYNMMGIEYLDTIDSFGLIKYKRRRKD